MKIILPFILLQFLTINLYADDEITLKNGSHLKGKIISLDSNEIILDRGNSILNLKTTEVQSYSFDQVSNSVSSGAFSLGITLGFPSVINLTFSYSAELFHTRVSGCFLPEYAAGILGLIGYPIYDSKKAFIAPSLFIGTSKGISDTYVIVYSNGLDEYLTYHDITYTYFGLGVDVNFYGVTAFLGYGSELTESIHGNNFIFDIGYKYSFY